MQTSSGTGGGAERSSGRLLLKGLGPWCSPARHNSVTIRIGKAQAEYLQLPRPVSCYTSAAFVVFSRFWGAAVEQLAAGHCGNGKLDMIEECDSPGDGA